MGAFGKNTDDLKRVADFRQAGQISNRKFPKKTGGGGARFNDNYKPSIVEPDTIRLIAGEYPFVKVNEDGTTENHLLPYARFGEHFDNYCKTGSICSAGPFVMYKTKRDPCIGCDLFWKDGGKKTARVSRREMYSFSIFNYATFHEVDSINDDGTPRMNDRTGKPYTQWTRCTGRRCDGCAANKPTKKGHMQHWEMGMGHFQALKDYAKTVGRNCKNCLGQNTVSAVAYLCANCHDAVVDMATSTLSDEEIMKLVENETVCPHCRFSGYLEEIIDCTTCGSEAVRAGVYDVDLQVKRVQGEGNQTTLSFTGFGPVCPIDPIYEAKPLDLMKMYEPTPIEVQAAKFKEPVPQAVPRQPVPASQVSRAYGGAQTNQNVPQHAATVPAQQARPQGQWPSQLQAAPAPAPQPQPQQQAPRGGGMFSRR